MLYDVIERQRLEAGVLERIDALVSQVPAELRGYLTIPIARGIARPARRGKRVGRVSITVITTGSGWFVSAGEFYTQRDHRWLAKLDMPGLKACLRFLTTGKDLGFGLSVDAAMQRARSFKHECDTMQWL